MARRDLLVELRSFKSSLPPETTFSMYQAKNQDGSLNWSPIRELDQILQEPVLARTRVVETAACGVYKTFRLNGPATYYVRIAKNYSQSARLNGIFISRLPDSRLLAPPPYDEKQFFRGIFCEYQNILLHPVPENLQITKSEQEETVHAWDRVNQISWNPAELSRAHRWSMNAYRTLAHVSSQSTLIPAIRWNLKLWNQQERKQFEDTMLQCWFKNQEYFQGAYLSQEFFLDSPRVLPLKANDIELMKWMGLDWHKCFDGITPIEEEIKKLQERLEEVSLADRIRLQAEYDKKQEEKIRKAHEAMKSNL